MDMLTDAEAYSVASTPFQREVADRFGVLPNFFCTAQAAPGLIEELWGFAKAAYLDSPLPSRFKERLFVHLSRFCEVRYCIVRHVGFLIGNGRPAGDADASHETVDDVVALLRRPIPDAVGLADALARLAARDENSPIPEPGSQAEADLFNALTVIFVEPAISERARVATRAAVGDARFELLAAYLAFIRTAHYWTETHPELAYEPDMLTVMEARADLTALLLSPSDAERVKAGRDLRQVLTELQRTEAALRASEELRRIALESGGMGAWRWDTRERSVQADDVVQRLWGVSPSDQPHPVSIYANLMQPEGVALLEAVMTRETSPEEEFQGEVQVASGPNAGRWVQLRGRAEREQPWIINGVSFDITEERIATKRQEILVNELQHRARNLLGVVTAVAGKTLRQGSTVEAFEERLQALSRAQALLSRAGSDTVEVGAMVQAELAAYARGRSEGVFVDGPEVKLTARQVQNFALALHELTTNAVKYGALRGGTGNLAVTWEVLVDRRDRRRLALNWVESGVACEPEKVTRRGYGTELIQEALSYALEADVDYQLSADGVRCRVEMPIN